MRVVPAVLIGAFLMALTACSSDDTTTTPAAPAPATTTTAAAAADAGAPAPSDKELCEQAEKAGKAMKTELITAMQAAEGEPANTAMQKILAGLGEELNNAAGASTSEVGTAVKEFAAKSAEAAKEADPATAADNPAYEKAGKDLTAACKAVGVTVTY